MKVYPSPVVTVAIPLDELRPLLDEATWERVQTLLDEEREEEAEQLLSSCLPVLKGCRVYYPEDEDIFFGGMASAAVYVLVDPSKVYEMKLRPEATPLEEAGVRLKLQYMFAWLWPMTDEAEEIVR